MIDISFLRRPVPILHRLSGVEYMDWQNKATFFDELKNAFTNAYDAGKKEFDFIKSVREEISAIIAKHSNLSINVVVSDVTAAIDTGFINPGNVINQPEYTKWVSKEYSKFAEAFKDLKKDVIKGWANPKTGKVEGDFKNINFNLLLSPLMASSMDEAVLVKYGFTVPEVAAAFTLHECGHAYAGLLYVSSKVLDCAIITQATRMYLNTEEQARKVTIIKDALKELEVTGASPEDDLTEDSITIYFSKNVANRDYRRSLSLGVATMSFEVLADAYASRFGAGKQLIAGLASFGLPSQWSLFKYSAVTAAIISVLIGSPFITVALALYIVANVFMQDSNLVSGIYDSPYRRIKTILRDHILNLNNSTYSKSEKIKMVESLRKMDDIVEENKTYFESTAVQRSLGWISSGTDFRKNDFENYSADLMATRLSLYGENYFS